MFIYKLTFTTPVRFGADNYSPGLTHSDYTCHSDTLFSAIVIEYLNIYGEESLNAFIDYAKSDAFNISDAMPFYYNDYFIPKPFLYIESYKKDISSEEYLKKRKKLKKLRYINISEWDEYIDNIQNGKMIEYDNPIISTEQIETKATISRKGEDAQPYHISSHIFDEGGGLYFISQCDNEKIKSQFDIVMDSLSLSGIGGKRTSGYGKFNYEIIPLCNISVLNSLINRKSSKYMLINLLSPNRSYLSEIKSTGMYQIINRCGFVQSNDYNINYVKKKDLHVFNVGSCFNEKYNGKIIDVSSNGSHRVYRFAKGFYIGVMP